MDELPERVPLAVRMVGQISDVFAPRREWKDRRRLSRIGYGSRRKGKRPGPEALVPAKLPAGDRPIQYATNGRKQGSLLVARPCHNGA